MATSAAAKSALSATGRRPPELPSAKAVCATGG